jgi:hypothetical protein
MRKRREKIHKHLVEPEEPKGFYWERDLPADIVKWAKDKLDYIVSPEGLDLECVDNFRVCKVGVPEQEESYNNQVKDGCCGSFDNEFLGPDGWYYMIGCNYGH